MKSYILLLVLILVALDEKRQVIGNQLCEELCGNKVNVENLMQCYKNSICLKTVRKCARQRKCPPTPEWKSLDTVKIIPIELPVLRRQRTDHVKIDYEFPIFKLKNVVESLRESKDTEH